MIGRFVFVLAVAAASAGAFGAGEGAGDGDVPHAIPDKAATRKQISGLNAAFQKEKEKATLGLLEECADLSISYGAPAWNEKDHEECLNFYVTTVQALADAFPAADSATAGAAGALADLKGALARAKGMKDVEAAAWIMRYAFDKTAIRVETEDVRAGALVDLGTAYLQHKDEADALDAFQGAEAILEEMRGRDMTKVPAACRAAEIGAANVLVAEKKYHEATEAIVKGLEVLPEWAQSKVDLRQAYGEVGELDDRISDIKAELRKAPADGALTFLLAYETYFTGDREGAKPLFAKAMSLDPKLTAGRLFTAAPI